jgi:pimeloyl-ACP methyl ester carboxylesterase
MLDGTMLPVWYSGSDGDKRPVGVRIRQGEGAVQVLAQFNAECKKAGPSACALAKLGDPATVVRDLYKRLKAKPVSVPLPDGTTVEVTYALAVTQTFFALYGPDGWKDFAEALAELYTASSAPTARTATAGGGKLSQTVQEWNRRKEEYTSVGSSLQPCIETRQTGRPLAYPAYADAADKAAPDFGRFRAWVGHPCEYMPIRDTDAFVGPWKNKVKSPVLVFGTKYDPATPYQATRPYTDLYPDGRMVTLNGWGHTTLGQSACADATITAYLVKLQAPADGTVCQPDRKPFTSLPSAKTAGLQRLVGPAF